MKDQEQKQIFPGVGPLEVMWFVLGGFSVLVYAFTRIWVGKRGWARVGPAALVVLIFWLGTPCPEVIPFFPVWMTALAIQRGLTFLGPRQIARYDGDFWPRYLIPFLGEQPAKLLVEPALAYIVGLCLADSSPRFGQLFQVCAGAMFLRQSLMMWIAKSQDDAAWDMEEDMRQRWARMRR